MSEKVIPTAQVLQLPLQAAQSSSTHGSSTGGAAKPYRPPSDIHPVLRRAGAPPAALDLLAQAYRGLDEARGMQGPLERYAIAHLAALRASAAVLAVRGRPEESPRKRGRIRSAWEVLPEVAPELAEWAVYYAAGAPKRAAAEAGIASAATMREADDLIRNTALFVRMVQRVVALQPVVERAEREGEPPMPRTG
ncbi:SAV_6107 family HEPN domain-containing protein [Streptacidiphilus sp. N1-12]|uniref:SAV_6107 family HEPN domain-containing protein n=2 Tax=Streptacidiphilus alkalitolerans TaxID=3342712 RepID=A0ABV6VFA7_9ACTN